MALSYLCRWSAPRWARSAVLLSGVFASGAVDSLWQNGIGDVGGAIEDGAEAVGHAGSGLGGAAEDAWNAIF